MQVDDRQRIVADVLHEHIDTVDTFEEWADLILKALDERSAS